MNKLIFFLEIFDEVDKNCFNASMISSCEEFVVVVVVDDDDDDEEEEEDDDNKILG